MTQKDKYLQSALIMCRPNLKGFFYFRFFEKLFSLALNFILPDKKAQQLGAVHSSLGSSALIVLPSHTEEVKKKSLAEKEKEILKGVELAIQLGAKKIAFAGLIPSLLNHFHHLENKELLKHKAQILTGQNMTCMGIGAVFEKLAKKTNCKILSVVGMGAIGSSSLILLLEKILKPEKIILCELRKRKKHLEEWADEIKKNHSIAVDKAFYGEKSFSKVYEGDMILGAISSRSPLETKQIKKGAILVDDSFPPIVSIRESIDRMKSKKDVLILSGGKMRLPGYSWTSAGGFFSRLFISFFLKQLGSKGFPGCWLEALVGAYQNAGAENASSNLIKAVQLKQKSEEKTEPGQKLSSGLSQKTGAEKNIRKEVLKTWELKNSLALRTPEFHFFKYQIPKKLMKTVYQIRKTI